MLLFPHVAFCYQVWFSQRSESDKQMRAPIFYATRKEFNNYSNS